MFLNIGQKIKDAAELLLWLGIIVSVATGVIIAVYSGMHPINGVFIGLLGCVLSYCLSIVIYGYGTLVEDIRQLNHNINMLKHSNKKILNKLEKTDN